MFVVRNHRREQEPGELSDRDLLMAVAEDDEAALEEVIARKTQKLLQLAYRMVGDREEARDLVQWTFVKAWESRRRYDPTWSANTWLYRITTNLAIDSLRAHGRRQKQQEPVRHHFVRALESRQRNLSQLREDEVTRILHSLTRYLTERQRAVFVLREVEGVPAADVAKMLGCRPSTVRNHLFVARRVLREKLLDDYPEYAPARAQGGAE